MHTRSAILLAVALSLPGSAGVAQMSRATLVKQSDIIFVGTVTRVGAVAVPEVPASPRTVVVRVDQVLEKPSAVALATGDSVTVETRRPGSLKAGTQATFYTTGWIFGRGVAVREVGHEPGRSPVVVRFPGSPDVAWVGTPKFAVGQEGTFLLHKDSTTGSPLTMIAGRSVPAYTALHKVDVLSKQDATRVRALIRKP